MRALFFSFLAFLCVLFCFSCGCGTQKLHSVFPDSVQLRVGDVVFRLGESLESNVVNIADRGGRYSHCGIVVDSAGQFRVVHAVPDELDFPGDSERVKMDEIDVFFRQDRAWAGAVCRMDDSLAALKAAEKAKAVYLRHTLFDNDYDECDTTKFYCSELIWHAYKHAGYDIIGPERHSYNVLFRRIDSCIVPSQVYNSPYLHPVALFSE